MCYCSYCSLPRRATAYSQVQSTQCNLGVTYATLHINTSTVSKQHVEWIHTDRVTNLARSSYSGSFKVMHLGPLKSRQRAVYTVLYILYIMSIVSVHIASNKRWKLRSSTTHSRLTPLPKEPTRISLMYLIFLETRIIDLHFPADSLCLSSFNFFWWAAQLPARLFYF